MPHEHRHRSIRISLMIASFLYLQQQPEQLHWHAYLGQMQPPFPPQHRHSEHP